MQFTDAELSLICIHIGKLIDEKVIERDIPEELIHELVDTVTVSYTHLTLPTKRIV